MQAISPELQARAAKIKLLILDVDGVYLTFELTAIKTVLPLTEGIPAVAGGEGSVDVPEEESAIEE